MWINKYTNWYLGENPLTKKGQKTDSLSEKSINIVMSSQKKKNSDWGLSKRKKCSIQSRANINSWWSGKVKPG